MIEVMQFIFSDFWIWFGTVILVAVFGTAVSGVVLSIRGVKSDD